MVLLTPVFVLRACFDPYPICWLRFDLTDSVSFIGWASQSEQEKYAD